MWNPADAAMMNLSLMANNSMQICTKTNLFGWSLFLVFCNFRKVATISSFFYGICVLYCSCQRGRPHPTLLISVPFFIQQFFHVRGRISVAKRRFFPSSFAVRSTAKLHSLFRMEHHIFRREIHLFPPKFAEILINTKKRHSFLNKYMINCIIIKNKKKKYRRFTEERFSLCQN